MADPGIVVVWARNLYLTGTVTDSAAAFEVSSDGHWIYVALHTIDAANMEYMRWVKMSTVDGAFRMAKGSWSGATQERPNRQVASSLTVDNNQWWVPIQRKMTPVNTWSAAIIKLDSNLDVLNYHYIQETSANRVHDISSIKISKLDRKTLYIGGRLDKGT